MSAIYYTYNTVRTIVYYALPEVDIYKESGIEPLENFKNKGIVRTVGIYTMPSMKGFTDFQAFKYRHQRNASISMSKKYI